MPAKYLLVEGVGELPFYKRKGSSSVRIRINGSSVKVTLPPWMPYRAAVMYVQQKAQWINRHREDQPFIQNGSIVGKQHTFHIKQSQTTRITGKVYEDKIVVTVPNGTDLSLKTIQHRLERHAEKALLVESEELIIPQARDLANKFGFTINRVEIKNLKSRWGSCSSHGDLAFSLFLVQLPWECIDYVIIHELAHTKEMNHSPKFWKLVEAMEPKYKEIRRSMKRYSPQVTVLQA